MLKLTNIILVLLTLLMFSAPVAAQQAESQRRDGVWDKNISEKMAIPYDHIREADVFWARRVWRVIDVREKMNLPFKYPVMPLIQILLDNVITEPTVTVFTDENFTQAMTAQEVSQIGAGSDTIPLYDEYGEYIKDTTVVNEFNPENVRRYRIKEDWFFDKNTSTMQVRIVGVAPLLRDVQADIEIPMFWVYYPDLRPVLANYEVFNPRNDAVRLSWDDLFEMRYFSSYIMKESNVYDRRIQDYATGVDALLESDRIKHEMFEFEHDLWTY